MIASKNQAAKNLGILKKKNKRQFITKMMITDYF